MRRESSRGRVAGLLFEASSEIFESIFESPVDLNQRHRKPGRTVRRAARSFRRNRTAAARARPRLAASVDLQGLQESPARARSSPAALSRTLD